jgi:hypothetical protein
LEDPFNFLDDELHGKNTLVEVEITRQLPFFESHQASAEICSQLGLVTGVTPHAISLLEKLLNVKERKYSSHERKNQLSNLANTIMNHAWDKDG